MRTKRRMTIASAGIGLSVLIAGSYWAASKIAIWDSVKQMWPDPWFKITMIDLYIGFVAVACIIGNREKSVAKTSLWVVVLAGLGNMATLLYLIIELARLNPNRSFWEPKREKWKLF